jgi:hypothetical protein
MAIYRLSDAFAHNALAKVLGLGEKHYSEGRQPTSQWMTRVAAGDTALTGNTHWSRGDAVATR